MKIKALMTIFVLGTQYLAFSQKEVSIQAGPVLGFPLWNKNFSYYYKNGIGASLQANFKVTKLGFITAKTEFLSIGVERSPVKKTSLTLLTTGFRTNFSDSRFFVEGDAGLALYGSSQSRSNGRFVVGASVGYSFMVSSGSFIEVFPSYNQIIGTSFNSQWLTASVVYRFSLVKKNRK